MKKLVLFAYFRAFYLAKRRHLRVSKILVLLAKNHKTKLKIPAFLMGHCALPSLNSSLGNHLHNAKVPASSSGARSSAPHSQGEAIAQSNTANTRIVCGEILDSQNNSESTLSDSYSTSESASPVIASAAKQSTDSKNMDCHADKSARNDDKTESYPHTNLESKADSERTSAVGQYPTAIKIKSCVAPESRPLRGVQKSETRRAVVPRRRFLARSGNSEALPLIAEKKKRSFILFGAKGSGEGINPFSFCDTRFKESIESKEVKNEDSEKADLESQTTKNKDSQLDSKTMDCHAGLAPAKSRNDKILESTPLISRINSHSTIAESTSNAHIKAHSLYFTYKRGYYA